MDPSGFLDAQSTVDLAGDLTTVGDSQEHSNALEATGSSSEPVDDSTLLPHFERHLIGVSGQTRTLFGGGRRWGSTDTADSPLGGQVKRAFDLSLTAIIFLSLLPILLILAMFLKLYSRGPAFYIQTRVGFRGKAFPCFKFRTMVVDGDAVLAAYLQGDTAASREWADTHKLKWDPRVTPIGRVLRRTSLDELPQLLNVLRGEMSLVGPRPIIREELARYSIFQNSYLCARPGLTGLWQVSGRSNVSYQNRIELDRSYVARWSIWNDVRILARTIPAVLRTNDAA